MALGMALDKRALVVALLLLVSVSLFLAFAPFGISEDGYYELLGSASLLKVFDISFLKILAVFAAFASSAIIFVSTVGIAKEYGENLLMPAAATALLFLFSYFVMANVSFVTSPAQILSLPFLLLALMLAHGTTPQPPAERCKPIANQKSNSDRKTTASEVWFASSEPNICLDRCNLVALVPLAIGLFLVWQYAKFSFDLSVFSQFPFIIAFSALSVGHYLADENKKIEASLFSFVLGLVFLFVLPVLSLALFSFSSSLSLKKFFSEVDNQKNSRLPVLILVFSLAFFITLPFGNAANSLIVACAITVFAYFIFSLYYFNVGNLASYVVMFAIIFSFSFFYFNITANPIKSPDEFFISSLRYAAANGLNPTILDMQYAYEFYVGKKPVVVNGTELLSKNGAQHPHPILLSSQSLAGAFLQHPIAFRYAYTVTRQNSKIAVFAGGPYILAVPLSTDGGIGGDGMLYGADNGDFVRTIPFTKLRQFKKSLPLENKNSVVLNVDGYEDTNFYRMIVGGEVIFENEGTKIVRVV